MAEELSIVQKIRNRYSQLETIRQPFYSDWKQIAKYIYPRREFLDIEKKQGLTQGTNIYDSSPAIAVRDEVNGIQGHLVSPALKWFDLEFMDPEIKELKFAKEWLDDVREHLYDVFERSNFYSAINQFLWDFCTFATASMYCEENIQRGLPWYSARQPGEIVIAENQFGEVDTVLRLYKLAARVAAKVFPKTRLPNQIVSSAQKSGGMDQSFKFIHAVLPVSDEFYKAGGYKGFDYVSIHIPYDAGSEDDLPLHVGGYHTFPYAVSRFYKNSSEWYGRGPSHDAMPDVRTLQQIAKDMLDASHGAIAPPMKASAELAGRLRLNPRGITYIDRQDQILEQVYRQINYPFGIERLQDLRAQIRKHFMTDFFVLLTELEYKKRTATEVMKMEGEKAAILGPVVGNIEGEILDPLINRPFMIEYEAERIPPIPPELADYGGTNIRISYIGPLAQMQQRAFKAQGVIHTLSALGMLFEIYPHLRYRIDEKEAADQVMETYDMPHSAIRSDDEYEKLVQAEMQSAAQEKQLIMAKELASIAPSLSKKVEGGSPLEAMQEALGG